MASVRKDRNRFRASWDIYEGGVRKQRSRSFARLKDARAFAAEIQAREGGRRLPAPVPTLSAFIPVFISALLNNPRKTVAGSTIDGYLCKLKLAEPMLGALRLDRIDAQRIDDMLESLAGRQSPRSISHVRTTLSGCFKEALRRQLVAFNPVSGTLPIPCPSNHHGQPTEDQVRHFLTSGVLKPRNHAFVLTAYYSGARRGEILGLSWPAIDFEAGSISIHQVVAENSRDGLHIRQSMKTEASRRVIFPPPALFTELRAWRSLQQQEALRWGATWPPSALLFPAAGTFQEPHSLRVMSRAIRRAMTRAGLPGGISPVHGWRHHLASRLIDQVAVKLVSETLGHSSTAITENTYQRSNEAQKRALSRVTAEVLDLDFKKKTRSCNTERTGP
jgi:integrase